MHKSKFVIYGVPRVGSNYLISVLNNHPKVLCHYEIFHKQEIYTGFWDKRMTPHDFGSLESRDQNPHLFLNNVFTTNFDFEAIGYNLFPEHNREIFIESLRDRSQKKIIIKRRDVLRNYVSWKIAMVTDIWTQREVSKKGEKDKRIQFDKNEFLNRLNSINKYYSFLETSLSLDRQKSFIVNYEDFAKDPTYYSTQLFEFIDVEPIEVKSETEIIKQNSEELKNLIINYDEFMNFCENYTVNS